jgi:hypothetical protein
MRRDRERDSVKLRIVAPVDLQRRLTRMKRAR